MPHLRENLELDGSCAGCHSVLRKAQVPCPVRCKSSFIAVQLVNVQANPHSNETPHIAVKDSAAPGIAQLLKSRIRFVGRFILEEGHYVHRSDSCMVIRGKDHIAADSYAKVKKILDCYNADRDTHEQDIHDSFEDLNEDDIGSITHGTTVDKFGLDQAFIAFAKKAGVDEQSAEKEMKRRLESLANQSGLD